MVDGKRVSPWVRQKGLEAGTRLPLFLGYPLPHRGSELGQATPARQAPRGLPGRPRPGQASGNGETGAAAPKRWRSAGREPPPRPAPPRSPPAARLPARSPPSWRRPCRRSAPPAPPVAPAAAAALGPPCRSRLGLASHARTACSLARPPVLFPVAAAHAHWLAGWREAAGCAAARAFSLAGCTRCGERSGTAEKG